MRRLLPSSSLRSLPSPLSKHPSRPFFFWSSIIRTLATAPKFSPEWRDRLQQWNATLDSANPSDPATPPDPSSLTDIGWAYHNGIIPSPTEENKTLPPDLNKAIFLYEKAASLSYPPASSLLADIHFYGVPPHAAGCGAPIDFHRAAPHLKDVLHFTSADEQADAYVRVRALQKLGIITLPTDTAAATAAFTTALDHCKLHLGGNYAFLLPHDPVQFFENLESEREQCDDMPLLQQNLSPFVTAYEAPVPLEAMVAVRSYTNKLREVENADSEFSIALTKEAHTKFPGATTPFSWGVTYLSSCMKVFGHPVVQNVLKSPAATTPHVVSLGAALGNTAIWPAAAFGFTSTGFDLLDTATTKATELLTSLAGDVGTDLQTRVKLQTADVLTSPEVAAALPAADVVWLNDFSWSPPAQLAAERVCFDNMRPGAALVLYRLPVDKSIKWDIGGVLQTPVSWHPANNMVIVKKPL